MKTFLHYLDEATIKDIVDGTKTFQNNTGAHVDRFTPQASSVKLIKITPWVGTKTLMFSCEINSFERDVKYNVTILFEGVEFGEEKLSPSWKEYEGVWFKKPNVVDNNCRLRCSCPDFRFRYSIALSKNKSLQGKLISYKKKTDRPPLNPDDIIGYCKHVNNVLIALADQGWIENITP